MMLNEGQNTEVKMETSTAETSTVVATQAENKIETSPAQSPKTFSQQEVDALVAKRLEKEKAKVAEVEAAKEVALKEKAELAQKVANKEEKLRRSEAKAHGLTDAQFEVLKDKIVEKEDGNYNVVDLIKTLGLETGKLPFQTHTSMPKGDSSDKQILPSVNRKHGVRTTTHLSR